MTQAFIDKYGNPDANGDGILDRDWFDKYITVFPMPWPMLTSWDPVVRVTRFQAHKLVGERIARALQNMADAVGVPFLQERGFDRWGGCFNFRLIRGGNTLSAHSWGTAVDVNPHIGRLGSAPDAAKYPSFIVTAFEAEGFAWGGLWQRPDAMHFEVQD